MSNKKTNTKLNSVLFLAILVAALILTHCSSDKASLRDEEVGKAEAKGINHNAVKDSLLKSAEAQMEEPKMDSVSASIQSTQYDEVQVKSTPIKKLVPIKENLIKLSPNEENQSKGVEISFGSNGVQNDTVSNKDVMFLEVPRPALIEKTHIEEGSVVYNIPNKMKVRSTYQVILRISKSKKIITLIDGLKDTTKTTTIPVTQTMQVLLVDPSPADEKMFEIVSDDNAVQLIDGDDSYTQWTWDVTPTRVGNSNLKIVVSIIRDDNKKDVVYQDTVMVESDFFVQAEFFFREYWKWILTSIIIPLIIWGFKKFFDKKKAKK